MALFPIWDMIFISIESEDMVSEVWFNHTYFWLDNTFCLMELNVAMLVLVTSIPSYFELKSFLFFSHSAISNFHYLNVFV